MAFDFKTNIDIYFARRKFLVLVNDSNNFKMSFLLEGNTDNRCNSLQLRVQVGCQSQIMALFISDNCYIPMQYVFIMYSRTPTYLWKNGQKSVSKGHR